MVYKVLLFIDFSEEYGRGLLSGIAKYSQLFGPWSFCRFPLIYKNEQDIDEILNWAKDWSVDGIIAQIKNEDVYHKLLSLNKPVIAQDANERFSQIPNITGYYHKTGQIAAKYYLKKGFRHFAFYGFNNIVWSRERCKGFCEYIEHAGYEVHVYEHQKEQTPPLWSYKESSLTNWLKSLPKPVALMACDDNQGQHITEACKIVGLNVPEQISVLGVDNDTSICNLSDPPLSSISLNTEKGGFEAAKLLHQMMNNSQTILKDIYVEHLQIVTRRSSDFLCIEDEEISKALHFIYYHYKENICVNDVVNATSLSRRVLEKRFRAVIDRSIFEEINSLRISHVKQLLLETEMPVSEIAIICGYSDIKNMSRYFHNYEGMSPLKFRKHKKLFCETAINLSKHYFVSNSDKQNSNN